MNETLKTTTVDQLPTADKLDGLFVFAYDGSKAVGKRSVKAPITLLKGNTGATGAAGKDGKDGEVTAVQLAAALTSDENLATEATNGLMSKEQVKQLNEIIESMKPLEDKYDSFLHVKLNNETTETIYAALAFVASSEDAVLEVDGVPAKINVESNLTNRLSLSVQSKGDAKLWFNSKTSITLFHLLGKVDFVRITSRGSLAEISMSEARAAIVDFSAIKNLARVQCARTRIAMLDLGNNKEVVRVESEVNDQLTRINVYGDKLELLSTASCPKLTTIHVWNKSLPALKTLYIHKTAISKSMVISIGNLWGSRVGKDTGVISLDTTLYNELSADERKIFTDKNITFDLR